MILNENVNLSKQAPIRIIHVFVKALDVIVIVIRQIIVVLWVTKGQCNY